MTELKFYSMLSEIDDDLLTEAVTPIPMHKKPTFRILLVAAALTLLLGSVLLSIPFIPKTYELDYLHSAAGQMQEYPTKNVRIYYTNQNGAQRSEYVRLPVCAENVFLAWKHLNGIGDEAVLIDYSVPTQTPLFPFLQNADRDAVLILSEALKDRSELLESLQKTFAAYLGIPENMVTFTFADPDNPPPVLEFSYDLQGQPIPILKPGDTLQITVTMTNVSDMDLVHEGFNSEIAPYAYLKMGTACIYPQSIDVRQGDQAKHRLAPKESVSAKVTFEIPEIVSNGHYALLTRFTTHSTAFENAAFIVSEFYDTESQALDEFHEFMNQYTPAESSSVQFHEILDALQYDGVSIMDSVQRIHMDGERFGKEFGSNEHFGYSISSSESVYSWAVIYQSTFFVKALPDGMSLPAGIEVQDSILHALLRMGYDEQVAKDMLDELKVVYELYGHGEMVLASQALYGNQDHAYTGTLLLCYAEDYYLQYQYRDFTTDQDGKQIEFIKYVNVGISEKDQRFMQIEVGMTQTTVRPIAIQEPVVWSQIMESRTPAELSQTHTARLQDALTGGTWQHCGDTQRAYNCIGMVGENEIRYDSEVGLVWLEGFEIKLKESDRLAINKLLGSYLPDEECVRP